MGIILLIGLLYAVYEYGYKPRRKAVGLLKTKLETVTFDLERAKQESANLERLKATFEKVRRQVAAVEEKLPREKGISELLRQLSREANATPIDFVSITPQKGVAGEGILEKLPLEIGIRCGYYGLTKYLQKLENLSRLIDIKRIYIKSDENIPPRLSVSLVADIFMFKDEVLPKEIPGKGILPPASRVYEKDPFRPLGKEKLERKTKFLTLSLTGILWKEEGRSLAIINDEVVGEGDFVGEKKVLEIKKDEVLLLEGEEKYVLKLEE